MGKLWRYRYRLPLRIAKHSRMFNPSRSMWRMPVPILFNIGSDISPPSILRHYSLASIWEAMRIAVLPSRASMISKGSIEFWAVAGMVMKALTMIGCTVL